MKYENYEAISMKDGKKFDKHSFLLMSLRPLLMGDSKKYYELQYGKDGCEFIANAISYFAGYENYMKIEW